jgi:hypothetical protein
MKPQGWDQFLRDITNDYDIHGKLKEVFLARFAYENWRKSDLEVWELAEAASHETYKKQMTQIYSLFAKGRPQGCPELDPASKGPGKFQILREWFKDIQYPQWLSAQGAALASPGLAPLALPRTGDNNLYITRPPIESECLQELTRPGALLRIKAPEKMGKTALLKLLLQQAEQGQYRTVYLNLQAAESSMFSSLDKFLRWFCANISRELALKPQLDDYWDEELFGSLVSCKTYFQSCLLEASEQPLVLGLDNLDRLFDYPVIAEDFLPMLRYWHEESNNLPVWQNLRLILANSTEAYLKLEANQSPFNVGKQVKLPGFNLAQVMELVSRLDFDPTNVETLQPQLAALTALVGGHPYLIRLALNQVGSLDVQQLLAEAPTQGGIYSAHLRRHWSHLQANADLAAAMKQVISQAQPVQLEPMAAYRLESMGLITLLGDLAQASCPLYQRYFADHL